MGNCLEQCNEFARSKSARVIYGVIFTIVCIAMIYRLYDASNQMQEQNLWSVRSHSNLQLLFNDDGSLLHFNYGSKENLNEWNSKFEKFLAPYKTPHPNRVKCDYRNPPPPGKSCDVDLNLFGPCSPSQNYGVSRGSACVFLKLKKNESWTPQFYNASDPPKDIPQQLKNFIDFNVIDKSQKMAWVTCYGKDAADSENLGPVSYIPEKGFHDYQFESLIEQKFEPVIAIEFERPTNGILISVECKLWTRNSDDRISFQLLIDY